MAEPTLDKAKVIFTCRMSSAMAVRTILKTALLMNWVFMTATTLKMLESSVKVRMYRATVDITNHLYLFFSMYRGPCKGTNR